MLAFVRRCTIADRPLEERSAVEARELALARELAAREIVRWGD